MLIEEYLQMRIQSAELILAAEELAGNVPKAMAKKSAIAELRKVGVFLSNYPKSNKDICQNAEVLHYRCKDKARTCDGKGIYDSTEGPGIEYSRACSDYKVLSLDQRTKSPICPKCGGEVLINKPTGNGFCIDCQYTVTGSYNE